MEALEFLKEAQRMCKSYADCKGCPLLNSPCGFIRSIEGHSDADIRCTIKVIEQWSKEHPPKLTNAQKFKEVFGVLPTDYVMGRSRETWWDKPYKEPEKGA